MNEFYAFQEVEQLTENLRMWQQTGDFNGGTSVHNPTVLSLRLIEIRWGVWVGLISKKSITITIQNGRVQVPRSASCMSFRCWRIWSTRIASCGMRLRVGCCIFSKVRPM